MDNDELALEWAGNKYHVKRLPALLTVDRMWGFGQVELSGCFTTGDHLAKGKTKWVGESLPPELTVKDKPIIVIRSGLRSEAKLRILFHEFHHYIDWLSNPNALDLLAEKPPNHPYEHATELLAKEDVNAFLTWVKNRGEGLSACAPNPSSYV